MQLDVFKNENPASRERFPYLLDVQADLLQDLETRIVVPLAPEAAFASKALKGLMPLVRVKGKAYLAVTPQLAAIARRALGTKIANLSEFRADLTDALDLLFTGA